MLCEKESAKRCNDTIDATSALVDVKSFVVYLKALDNSVPIPSTSEMNSLKSLYDACNGIDWLWNSTYGISWNFTYVEDHYVVNPCFPEWQGIKCNCVKNNRTNPINDNRPFYSYYYYDDAQFDIGIDAESASTSCTILQVDLRDMNLDGTIPNSIDGLTGLTSLLLSYNSLLQGEIPSEIWKLTKLQQLHLSHTRLQGRLSSAISSLRNLTQLAITDTSISGTIPASLFSLSNLEELYLGSVPNMVGDISTSIKSLSKLQVLSMPKCGALLGTTLPTSVMAISSLKRLALYENDWKESSIPAGISNLDKLIYLNLGKTHIQGTRMK